MIMETNDFDLKSNIKVRIRDNVKAAIKEYEGREGCNTTFGEPIIGYVSVDHPMFMLFFDEGVSSHPKEIYRPGNTLIVHFVPYSKEIIESNRGGELPSQAWSSAFYDSMHLSMYLNRVIRDTLDEVGRIHSSTAVPTDWNDETHRPSWSHKLAAYAASLGRFGIGGSFHTEMGFGGRLDSVLVDEHYAPFEEKDLARFDFDQVLGHIRTDSKYLGAEDVEVSPEAISACPGGAITEEGIDRKKCQDYCKTINEYIPSPEVCGKCFFYDI
ncbi:MAG: hypothetical protein RR626_04845 [Anaerovoracaceae bacterium]